MENAASSVAASSSSVAAYAPPSPTPSSSAPSSTYSTPSSHLSPSRGVKRTRDADTTGAIAPPVAVAELRASKRAHGSPTPSTVASSANSTTSTPRVHGAESLRISNELLRSENDQLQTDLQQLRDQHAQNDVQLAKQKLRIRNLEEDLTRMYRRQKRDAETRHMEHAKTVERLREQLETMTKQLEDQPPPPTVATLLSSETTQEMDAFAATCAQWQSKLTALSVQLAVRVEAMEQETVEAVLAEMCHKVAASHDQSALEQAQESVSMQRMMLRQQEGDVALLVARLQSERHEVEGFEALERRVLEDRVVDLGQKLHVASENDRVLHEQMAALRDELATLRSGNHVLPQKEWQQTLHEKEQMVDQLEALSVQCEAQTVQLTLLREDLACVQAENDELVADLAAHKASAAAEPTAATVQDDGDALAKQQLLEARIEELNEQLSIAKKASQDAEHQVETLKNRVEVLTMNVDAKAKAIDAFQTERAELSTQKQQALAAMQLELVTKTEQLTEAQQTLHQANLDNEELKKQLTLKACDWVDLRRQIKQLEQQIDTKSQELRRICHEKTVLEAQNEELKRNEEQWLLQQPELAILEQKNKELMDQHHHHTNGRDGRIQEQMSAVERENKRLHDELVEAKTLLLAAAEATSNSDTIGLPGLSPDVRGLVAQAVAEKRAMEKFVDFFAATAEAKCEALVAQVAQLQAEQETHRQRTRESRDLLRMCAQVDSCDSTIRASLLDVMATLEVLA